MQCKILIKLLLFTYLGVCMCQDEMCSYSIVESMPEWLTFNGTTSDTFRAKPTHESLLELIASAQNNLRIASYYFKLTAESEYAAHPSAKAGRDIMASIVKAVQSRGVKLDVLIDGALGRSLSNQDDLSKLESIGTVRYLDMKKLKRNGIMHSKFLIADNRSLYVGSSNFDWLSYTQIKEIGIEFTNCAQMAQDLDKTFETYWFMATRQQVPRRLPSYLNVEYNHDDPHREIDTAYSMYLANSPPAFNGLGKSTGRSHDIDALVSVINSASEFVRISVAHYSPRSEFMWPKRFWPRIHDALIKAATERRVMVSMLVSNGSHTKADEIMWYKSLNQIQSPTLAGGGVSVKMFEVPKLGAFESALKLARFKHDKYMVTEKALYIGTSNWTPDYFMNTCGVSLVVGPSGGHKPPGMNGQHGLIGDMSNLFERDFTSGYASELEC